MKTVKSIAKSLNGKKIILRLDLNVPLYKQKITDTNRIDKIIPTLDFLVNNKAKILILSHVGRPKGKVIKELSMKPVCEYLKNKLSQKIRFIKTNIKNFKEKDLFDNKNESILMLENLRFYNEEEENNEEFARVLASFGDLYVNDAFSCSHRKHASVFSITKYVPSYAGIQLMSEVTALNRITKDITRPITCIIGGSKISTKINVIKNLIARFDNIIFVGGMANNILKNKKFQIGKSIFEENCDHIVEEIFNLSKKKNCKIIYPVDVSVSKKMDGKGNIKKIGGVEKDDLILDIGPETLKIISKTIEESRTVLWNGPAGYFENKNFKKGSLEIARKIVEKNKKNEIYSVAGGGDTVAALNSFNLTKHFNFVSTAGGAFLEFLEGKDLPGIKALY
jgi:phosphoglycerate kinase